MRLLVLLLPLLLAACQYAQPSPVGTNCVHYGLNPIPVCSN
jgi:hypothetical protein